MRLLRSRLTRADLAPQVEALADALFQRGAVRGRLARGAVRAGARASWTRVLRDGAGWAVKRGLGWASDLEHCEEGGVLADADPGRGERRTRRRAAATSSARSARATTSSRCRRSTRSYDEDAARGARARARHGDGDDPLRLARARPPGVHRPRARRRRASSPGWGIALPDRQLACAPLRSPEARDYLGAMRAAANFAWANRQCIAHGVRRAFERCCGAAPRTLGLTLVYDVAHNIAKFETPPTSRGQRRAAWCIARGRRARSRPGIPTCRPPTARSASRCWCPATWGATRSCWSAPRARCSHAFGSTCHGAGRQMSRTQAVRETRGRDLVAELREAGVTVRYEGRDTLREETSEAYKDVAEVVRVCEGADLAQAGGAAQAVPGGEGMIGRGSR